VAGEAEQLSRPTLIAMRPLQRLPNQRLLKLFEVNSLHRELIRSCPDSRVQPLWQVDYVD
jgi:hypothetical protein